MGDLFLRAYAAVKLDEFEEFNRVISSWGASICFCRSESGTFTKAWLLPLRRATLRIPISKVRSLLGAVGQCVSVLIEEIDSAGALNTSVTGFASFFRFSQPPSTQLRGWHC